MMAISVRGAWDRARAALALFAPRSPISALAVAALLAPHPASAAFWDDYVALRDLLREDAASASAHAESLLAADPDHFLASWCRGEALARIDSVGRDVERVVAAEGRSRNAGASVVGGTALITCGDIGGGRAALDRARKRYLDAGRSLDAARASLWKVFLRRSVAGPDLETDLRDAESIARRLDDPELLADVLLVKAALVYKSDIEGALAIRREALSLLSPLGPSYQLAECHRGIGNALNKTGDAEAAGSEFEEALTMARGLVRYDIEGDCLVGLGNVRKGSGDLAGAIPLYQQAIDLGLSHDDAQLIASGYGSLGGIYRRLGRYGEARRCYEATLRVAGELDDDDRILLLDGLASLEALLGNLDRAQAILEEAAEMCRRTGAISRAPFVLLHLAQASYDLRDLERARARVEEGLDAARRVAHRQAEAPLLTLQTQILSDLGENEAALAAAESAARLASESQPGWRWVADRAMAQALHGVGRTREALDLLDRLIASFPERPDSLEMGRSLRRRAEILLDAGRAPESVASAENALAIGHALGNPLLTMQAELTLGEALIETGAYREAAPHLERCLASVERMRSLLTVSEDRSGHVSRWYGGYAALALAHARAGRIGDAFATFERSRAREMRELFGVCAPGLHSRIAGDLSASLRAVESEIVERQAAILHEYANPPAARSPELAASESRLDSLRTAWSDLSRRVIRETPDIARDAGLLPPIAADDLARALDRDERVLAYMTGRSATLVFDLRRGKIETREIGLGEKEIADCVAAFSAALEGTGSKDTSGGADERFADSALVRTLGGADAAERWRIPAALLGDSLFAGAHLAEAPPRILYIIPDGALHYLPFEVLLVPRSDEPPAARGKPGARDGLAPTLERQSERDAFAASGASRSGERPLLIELAEIVYAGSTTLLVGPAGGSDSAPSRPPADRSIDAARRVLVAFGDPDFGAAGAGGAAPGGTPLGGARAAFSPGDAAPRIGASAPRGTFASLVPLPFAREEVLSLRNLFPQARVFVGEEATEDRFFAEVPRASILHVAAHAFADDRHPEFSGFVLSAAPGSTRAGEAPSDGIVQAFEILEQRFDLSLAVLSACETGRGKLERGEGLMGLSRAFRVAGTRSLLVSLWKVDDAATAALMRRFYGALRTGASPSAALRTAKLAALAAARGALAPPAATGARGVGRRQRDEMRAGPGDWAPFILLGGRGL